MSRERTRHVYDRAALRGASSCNARGGARLPPPSARTHGPGHGQSECGLSVGGPRQPRPARSHSRASRPRTAQRARASPKPDSRQKGPRTANCCCSRVRACRVASCALAKSTTTQREPPAGTLSASRSTARSAASPSPRRSLRTCRAGPPHRRSRDESAPCPCAARWCPSPSLAARRCRAAGPRP